MLCDFERWVAADEIQSVLYRRANRLTPEQARAIREEAAAMRRRMIRLRDDLHLEGRSEDVGTMIQSCAMGYWSVLAQTGSKCLGVYGDVSSELAAYLDPQVQALNDHLQRIRQAAEAPPPTQSSG